METRGPDYEYRKAKTRSFWPVLVALLLAAVAALTLFHRQASPLTRAKEALAKVRIAKVVQFDVRMTARTRTETDYFMNGSARIEKRDGEIRLTTPFIDADYRPDTKTVLLSHRGNPATGLSGAVFFKSAEGDEVTVAPAFNSGGRDVYMLSDQVSPSVLIVYAIDASRSLPLSVQRMRRSGPQPGSSWLVFQETAITYPQSLPASLFDLDHLPKGPRILAER